MYNVRSRLYWHRADRKTPVTVAQLIGNWHPVQGILSVLYFANNFQSDESLWRQIAAREQFRYAGAWLLAQVLALLVPRARWKTCQIRLVAHGTRLHAGAGSQCDAAGLIQYYQTLGFSLAPPRDNDVDEPTRMHSCVRTTMRNISRLFR
jgi:hypothetical protein